MDFKKMVETYGAWSVVAFVMALVVLFIVGITALIDSSTFLSRIHTTLIAWNVPLATIGVIVLAFVSNKREGKANHMAWIAVAMMALALLCSNVTKNVRQDALSNKEALADVEKEAAKDNAVDQLMNFGGYDW